MSPHRRALLLFLDGVGIGSEDPQLNPFFSALLPTLTSLLGGRLPSLTDPETTGPKGHAFPLDALLEMDGAPQSGTGQASLFTGGNAAQVFGRHFGPWVPVRLRPLLSEQNLLVRAQAAGLSVAFANAYPEGFLERYPRRIAAPPLVADSAGVLTRHEGHLARGEAVASEIVNTGWIERLGHDDIPEISPEAAGRNLAVITEEHDLTLFAHYTTDLAGHRGGMQGAVEALERVDGLLTGLLDDLGSDTTVLIASDHGNIEDVSGDHTRNPALGLEIGPRLRPMGSILDVAGALLEHLGGVEAH